MGRGRAKAKQTKVARDLKYRTWETDLEQLKKELSGGEQSGNGSANGDNDADVGDDADDYHPRR
ncbi:DUF3073 family protein [Kribbella voronezhensis]|uniref:DUF3073 family protein n=1 Tax=Kribbella voronezhensis TaxID=2512212 RepID=A0A4R7TB28_9ACTN|nr:MULTISPECIES: DUF3073 domain-containing protein [Kribbella]TDU89221.1 DUF3073 family protein [Kribbella voronezhensis]